MSERTDELTWFLIGMCQAVAKENADRHQWAPAVLDEVLGMLGLTEVAA